MKIACILTNYFEDSEFRVPYDRLRDAGHDVVVIGKKKGEEIEGKQHKEKVRADAGIDEVKPAEFDAILIPGGFSPDQLRIDPRFVDFVKAFDSAKKPIAAVCHGPQILLTAGIVKGRKMTAWPTVQVDLKYAGANVVDQEAVVDGNLVTSRKPDDLEAFSREFINLLSSRAQARPAA